MPRLILLEDYRLEAYLDGVLFIFTHHDVPGIIGAVGSIFGKHEVNIAQMAVGRTAPGSDAIGILNLDAPPSDASAGRSTGTSAYSARERRPVAGGRRAAGLAVKLKRQPRLAGIEARRPPWAGLQPFHLKATVAPITVKKVVFAS